jgi:hypothetical protein
MRLPIAWISLAVVLLAAGCENMRLFGGGVVVGGRDARVAVSFSPRDRELIHEHYAGRRSKPLPPGLAKRDRLPPGLEKQLRKDGQLPPGLQRGALPYSLESRLSPLPQGYARVIVGGSVVLENTNTRVVVDIIQDVVVD